jgi:CRP-like cAMP-binding protein
LFPITDKFIYLQGKKLDLANIFGNLAFILIAGSFMVKDMLWLRSLSVTASFASLFYNFTVTATPLWTPIFWNFFFITLNVYHVSKILLESRGITFTPKETELYDLLFSSLSPLEFMKLNKICTWKKAKVGDVLIKEGEKVEALMLIYNGCCNIVVVDNDSKESHSVAELKDGQFIGEMSFLTEKDATATVIVHHPTEYLTWNQSELKSLMSRNPSLVFSLQKAMGTQITNALKGKVSTDQSAA